jgi:ring-1,2-phenylacetyl-CoA epoxidase subunit PaaC
MSALTPALSAALVQRLTALADDELILGHRNSEWTGHAPILEEDIAIANVAQDEVGHAVLWYGLIEQLTGSSADELAFQRGPADYRSAALLEQPRGDWAFTMLRQFLFDSYEAELYPRLQHSTYAPVAEVAAKVSREEVFHLRHSTLWVERLALGTDESRRRLTAALESQWPLLPGLLVGTPGDAALVEAGIFPAPDQVADAVSARVSRQLTALNLTLPAVDKVPPAGRHQRQGTLLAELLTTMQSVARADPAAEGW